MSREPLSNVAFGIQNVRVDPGARLRDPQTLIGCNVKKAFPIPGRPAAFEHMWVRVEGVRPDGKLYGVVNNDPVFALDYPDGTPVDFDVSEVELVYGGG